MRFFQVKERTVSKDKIEIYPDFSTNRPDDLMVRGKMFYAIWDDEKQAWSTDEYDVQRIVDEELKRYYQENMNRMAGSVSVQYMSRFKTRSWLEYRKYIASMPDNYHQLDEKIVFSNTPIKRTDYISRHLSYPLEPGPCDAYEEIISTLYEPEERRKIEWAIGAIISGDSKKIQKFLVFYGEGGTGKSTILNIIQSLFKGYYAVFSSKALGSNTRFAMEPFKRNPLVAIEHDGDLSSIEDNTRINQIVSHEEMPMDLKNVPIFSMRLNSFLLIGTNKPVKITDGKSGIIRRLIDVYPSGMRIDFDRYMQLTERVEFELSGIAYHCLEVYKSLGKSYYNNYVPRNMIYETDIFYNFVEENYFVFREKDGVTAKSAYEMYKVFCDESGITARRLTKVQFRSELKNYFKHFDEITRVDGKQVRSYYSGFKYKKFNLDSAKPEAKEKKTDIPEWLNLKEQHSLLDDILADSPAQYAVKKENGSDVPTMAWAKVKTKLRDLDTSQVHYVMPQTDIPLITVDFDLKDENGNKSFERNAEAASKWTPTYAECSKGGEGIHLEYYYPMDISKLSALFDEDIEIKTCIGKGSLRRRVSRCNDIPIATLTSGLPLKEAKKTVNFDSIANEKALRTMILKNLRKEYNPHTRPSIDYIYNDLEAAYNQGLKYDVRDLRPKVMAFANNSTHQSAYCVTLVGKMKFCSEEATENQDDQYKNDELIFYDVEVFPNLFLINWKVMGSDHCVRMVNPTKEDIELLVKMKLIGFNCRRYDNHMLYARLVGYTNEQLYQLSQRIINESRNALFKEAYNLSYTDVYDFCAKKQGLKKWEIELGIHHQELGLPWDQPVPEERWQQVAEYCDNDVIATEAVFNANQADFMARKFLADISKALMGYGTVNDTTNQLTTRIILRGDRNANKQFVDPDLKKLFPGYEFDPMGFPEDKYTEKFEKTSKRVLHKSCYKGCDPSEGGRVYARPGVYSNVWTFDVASMHPSSIIAENGFGKYTQNLKDLLDIRLHIKHKEYEALYGYFGGILKPYVDEIIAETDKEAQKKKAKALSYALKIAINSVYGLTSAKFDNPLRDPRNIDNWVAKRGALFMIDLQQAVEKMGYTVVHVKTDSIKVADPTEELKEFIFSYGRKYGYTFEIEAIYDRICLVNRAVYIAKYSDLHPDEEERGKWTATGDQFKQPYIFKTLFSKEPIVFSDMCETKTVQTALYLDMDENLPEGEHNYQFIGKAGLFCPVMDGCGGGRLLRDAGDGKYAYAESSSGYRWMEAEAVKTLGMEDKINRGYYNRLCDQAIQDISEFTDFEMFVTAEHFAADDDPPWDP